MRLTRFTDYGLRTLIYLALSPGRLEQISEIAKAYHVSENHMTKVVHRLGKAELIETIRGRHGGIRLTLPPAQILIGEVVRLLEADLAVAECLGGGKCTISGVCQLTSILDEGLEAMLSTLDRYTLADIINHENAALYYRIKGLRTAV